jgi:hypothetical protein
MGSMGGLCKDERKYHHHRRIKNGGIKKYKDSDKRNL